MPSKYSDRDLARAFILLATAVQRAKVCQRVREQVQLIREDILALSQNTGGAVSSMDNAFSAVYDLINVEVEPGATP